MAVVERKRLVISGATGFIGKYLLNYLFETPEYESYRPVVILSRSDVAKAKANLKANPVISKKVAEALDDPDQLVVAQWDTRTLDTSENGWAKQVDGAHAVIHLAGEGIFERRWSEEFKRELMDSRIRTTRLFADAIGSAAVKPTVFISASAIGIYGDTGDTEKDEDSPLCPKGQDFLADICHNWEAEALRAIELSGGQTRVAIPRIGIVLEIDGGALKNMLTPFWLHIGGHVGSGNQWFAWIHMIDTVRGVLFPLQSGLEGPYNIVAPNVARLRDFCVELGKLMNRWSWAHVPWLAARILLGEVANTLETNQRLAPKKLLGLGFQFQFPGLPEALADIVNHYYSPPSQ